ncbi:MAG: prefoldin subunit [Candidatus Korarchaeum sp.]
MSSDDYLQAKAEEILAELNQVLVQLASLRSEYNSIDEAIRRLENLPNAGEVFERVGVLYIRRDRESVLLDLKATRETLEAAIKSLEKKERDLRETLSRIAGSTRGS